jgi:Cyclic nucleotide-binding domain
MDAHSDRVSATAWSLSWIPTASVSGVLRRGFDVGLSHYDQPPPDLIADAAQVHRLRDADAFRFANLIGGWADVVDGRIGDAGFSPDAGLLMGSTTVRLARLGATFRGFSLPVRRSGPEYTPDRRSVTLVQTVGGRTGVPLPRPVPGPPFVQWQAPIVWTTLVLTLHADGSAQVALRDASAFPRHWLYGPDGLLVAKSGLTDQESWVSRSFGYNTPWGGETSTTVVAAAESSLERQLSRELMQAGREPDVRRVDAGSTVTVQGQPGNEIFLVLDGMLAVEVDGKRVTEVGPGAVLGERAVLEGGQRTATLVATTAVRIAVAPADAVDMDRLRALADLHRGEDAPPTGTPG